MHKSKVEAIYRLLECNNSDIARVLKCAPSDISRVRNGSRAYKPTSRTVLRFAEGIYLYADRNGTLRPLCKLCGAKPSGPEEVVPKLIAWLFDTKETALPDLSYIEERSRSIKKQKNLFFGEKLSRAMELTSCSNLRLAGSINMDVSVISRFRSGLRKPKPPIDALLASVLFERAEAQNKLSELSALCGKKETVVDLPAFSDWLYDDSVLDLGGVDQLLDSIEHFPMQEAVQIPDLSSFVTEELSTGDQTAYIGVEGLRKAVLRFLLCAAESGGELYLYSDQDMDWMVGDPDFRTKWKALMVACIRAGVSIRIIHNIDRGSAEMLEAIQSWMPLYITGRIEPYVCHLGRDNRFAKTLFIQNGKGCIVGSVLRGKEEIGYYEYTQEPERIRIHTAEFDALRQSSSPLLRIYFRDYTFAVGDAFAVKRLLPQVSLGSMPKAVLCNILDRSDLPKETRERILCAHAEKKAYFDTLSGTGRISEFICLPSEEALFAGKVRLPVPASVCDTDLFYTPEEFASHIAAILELVEKYANYDLVLLPEMPFSRLQIDATENSIAVTRTGKRYASFVFSDPRLLRSFSEYFTMLEEQYRTDKSTVKKELLRFL